VIATQLPGTLPPHQLDRSVALSPLYGLVPLAPHWLLPVGTPLESVPQSAPVLGVAGVGDGPGAGATTVTLVLDVAEGSAALNAAMLTLVLLVTAGAVKKPLYEIVPAPAVQVTAVLVVPCTKAVNC